MFWQQESSHYIDKAETRISRSRKRSYPWFGLLTFFDFDFFSFSFSYISNVTQISPDILQQYDLVADVGRD